jgi:hypothetical protein
MKRQGERLEWVDDDLIGKDGQVGFILKHVKPNGSWWRCYIGRRYKHFIVANEIGYHYLKREARKKVERAVKEAQRGKE